MAPDEISQYGESKAQEIQERRHRRRVADEKASVDGKLKTLWAPRLWQQVREEITQLVQSVNDAMGETVLACEEANPELVVVNVADTQSNLSAAFDSKAVRFVLTLNDHLETYNLEVIRGEVKLNAVGYFSPSQVAKMLVDKAATMVL